MPRNSRSKRVDESSVRSVARRSRKYLIETIDRLLAEFSGNSHPRRPAKAGAFASTEEMERAYERLRNVAEALRLWHSSDEYLNDDGTPKSLNQSGRTSLSSLAKRVSRSRRDRSEIIADLKNLNSIRRGPSGYAPTKRSAVLGVSDSLALTYATLAVSRLAETITHNFSGTGSRRYERQISEAKIRLGDLPSFLLFAEEQGQSLVDSVDDWLSKRAKQDGGSDDRISVSLGAFAWVASNSARLKARRRGVRGVSLRK